MNILFVCTGNTCRSAMAQAYFNAKAETCRIACHSDSAGIAAYTGQPATDEAVRAMRGLFRIDMSEHRSKPVSPELIGQSDLVLAMTALHKRVLLEAFPEQTAKIFTLDEYAQQVSSNGVADPYGLGLSAYHETAKNIASMIDRIIGQIGDASSESDSTDDPAGSVQRE